MADCEIDIAQSCTPTFVASLISFPLGVGVLFQSIPYWILRSAVLFVKLYISNSGFVHPFAWIAFCLVGGDGHIIYSTFSGYIYISPASLSNTL